MAWVFSLCARSTSADPTALCQHFEGLNWTRADGTLTTCEVRSFGSDVHVVPSGLSRIGLRGERDGRLFAEAAEHLYCHLKTAPPFDWALVGVEVDDERLRGEVVAACASEHFDGLVVTDSIWREAGQPDAMEPFGDRGRWRPFESIAVRVFKAPVGTQFLLGSATVIDRPGWFQVVSPGVTTHANEVMVSELKATEDIDARVSEVSAQYAALDVPFKWCIGPTTAPADTTAILTRQGMSSWGMRGMYARTDELDFPSPADADIREVRCRADAEAFAEAGVAGWGIPLSETSRMVDPVMWGTEQPGGQWRHFVAWCGGQPVGTAGLILGGGLGYLTGASVSPAARGQGLYRALIQRRMDELKRLGVSLAVTQAREATSAPILEALGFETAYRAPIFKSASPSAEV